MVVSQRVCPAKQQKSWSPVTAVKPVKLKGERSGDCAVEIIQLAVSADVHLYNSLSRLILASVRVCHNALHTTDTTLCRDADHQWALQSGNFAAPLLFHGPRTVGHCVRPKIRVWFMPHHSVYIYHGIPVGFTCEASPHAMNECELIAIDVNITEIIVDPQVMSSPCI